ncbi:hypothetical protein HYV49_05715 [Candidatus Pacearchaeota archaeon]|nr:hypothetical protein [Candidatus Pacearchaeota archaeon]
MESKVKFCPKCKKIKIITYAGGITGAWKCTNCNFMSTIFPEIVNLQNKKLETMKKHGRRRK